MKKSEKLIRDHIPGMPEDAWYTVDQETANEMLIEKLTEELEELQDTDWKDPYEFADVLEVLMAIARTRKVKWSDIEVARRVKFIERGGFSNKVLKMKEKGESSNGSKKL